MRDLRIGCPWLLSGGLSIDNLAAAVRLCGARAVDVSSGVEDGPGLKDPSKIRRFLELAASIEPPGSARDKNSQSPRS